MSFADGQTTAYAEPAGIVTMPAVPIPPAPADQRKARPGCPDCTLSERGTCARHNYNLLASVNTPPGDDGPRVVTRADFVTEPAGWWF